MRVAVVGAGLGGLAAAVAVTRAGHEVTVYERASSLRESGAGIGLMPNGVLALDALGVPVRTMALAADGPVGMRDHRGRLLLATGQATVERRVGAPVVVVRRQWLHRLLASALPSGVVRTGVAVDDVRTLDADLVVAADGAGSAARSLLFPSHPGVEGVGELAARAVVSAPSGCPLPAGELLDRRTGRRFGCMPIAGGDVYWYASWHGSASDDLRGLFAGWHPAVQALIEATGDPRVDELVRLARPLPSLVAGRVALLGDAAHVMTPDLGQGACLAFEDAVALAESLAESLSGPAPGGSVPAALARYDAVRRPRTSAMLRASNRTNRMLTLTGPAGWLRDTAARAVPSRLAAAIFVKQLRLSGPGALRSARRAVRREVADDRGSRV